MRLNDIRESPGLFVRHQAGRLTAGVALAIVAWFFLPESLVKTVTAWPLSTLASALPVLAILHFHDTLCIWCIRDSPLDAAARAEGFRRQLLRFYHAFGRRPAVISLAVYWAALVSALALQITWLISAANIGVCLLMAVAYHALVTHRQLVVHCPWCRGRGEPELVPEPVPQPTRAA